MKHTPGPWIKSTEYPNELYCRKVGTGDDGWLGVAQCFGDSEEEAEANARLIAAAPELLEALVFVEERLTRSGYPDGPNLQTLRTAIAKATGE